MLLVITIASLAVAAGLAVYAWRVSRLERERSHARVAALASAIDWTQNAPFSPPPPMFARDPESGVRSRPLLKLAIGFGMAVLIIVLVAMSSGRHQAPASAAAAATQESSRDSLELLSMRHERAPDALTVTGLVRNPGAPASGAIMAVVFAFDRDGGFVASGRAPLEFATISAGDESPFRVTIPGVKDVGRYRVSFRTDAGVVRHVDRRPTLQVSAN